MLALDLYQELRYLFFVINMHRWAHASTKYYYVPTKPSIISNEIPYPE